MKTNSFEVAIIGGGIGGLFAAKALTERGLRVTVYEQAPELNEIGAGVYVTPNSVRQLQRLGLGAAFESFAARVGSDSCYRRQDGSYIARVQTADANGWQAAYGMHRADFISLLANSLPPEIIHCDHRAIAYEESKTAGRVYFANGEIIEADVIVAADGIHSALRPHVHPPSQPVFHNVVAYRGLLNTSEVKNWPKDCWEMWAGHGRHFLVFPVRGGRMINYVGFVPADAEMKESWSEPGNPDVLRQEFAGWDPRVGDVLAAVKTTFRWALYDREPLPRWSRGRLTLLGDAAHPMLPHLGQGANQAIEDGMALAVLLANTDRGDIPQALTMYEKIRRERVSDIQRGARENGLRVESVAAYANIERRDRELRAHAQFRADLYAYDVLPIAETAAGIC